MPLDFFPPVTWIRVERSHMYAFIKANKPIKCEMSYNFFLYILDLCYCQRVSSVINVNNYYLQ